MRFLVIFMVLLANTSHAQTVEDKSVRWGYKVMYDPKIQLDELKRVRKILKAKEVTVMYPPERNWNLRTGFLSVSSYLSEEGIKALSGSIQKVESAEKTRLIKISVRSGVDSREIKKALGIFPNYKIQLVAREDAGEPVKLTVKTTLLPEQLKQVVDFGPLIDSVE